MKITIIGGSGFVGTNLCSLLHRLNYDFEIIDLKISRQFPKKSKIGDVRNIDSLKETVTGDVVVNLAAVHRDDIRDKFEYQQTNINGAKNVIRICTEKQIKKIIFTSTVAVYGFVQNSTDESGEIKPFNEYGRTKFEAEELLRTWMSGVGNSLIIIRPTVIFGEGNRGNVFNLFKQIASGKFLMVGSGKNKKSMAYIGNIVAFLEQCIVIEKKYSVYNYVDTPDISMKNLVSLVRETLFLKNVYGVRLPIWLGMMFGYFFDIVNKFSKKKFPLSSIRIKKFTSSTQFMTAKSDLNGFVAPFTLFQGIERTLESEFISPDPKREIFFTE